MVKHIKKIAMLFAGAMLLFASCSGLVDGTVSGNSSASDGTLSIKLGGDGTFARFLAPATLTTAGIDHYKITGESVFNGYLLPEQTYSSSTTPSKTDLEGGTATLSDVKLDDWNFTLWAYDSSDNLLLKGTTLCQMKSNSDTTVAFNLSSYDVSTVGSYDITIKYTGSNWVNDSYSFSWALYNVVTRECLTNTGATGGTATTINSTAADVITGAGYVASGTGVTPGTYLFGVYLKQGSTNLAFASDVLVIEPGRNTTQDFEIGDILDTIPDAPTDFKVQRILGSEDGDFYDVRLIWTDASTNETEFNLAVKEFTDTATDWPAYAANYDLSTDNAITVYSAGSVLELQTGDIRYVAGSLYAGSTELVLKVPTGRLFDFQIVARNDFGSSETVPREADATPETALTASGTGAATATTSLVGALTGESVVGYDAAASAPFFRVNLVRITYDLNGGTLKTASAVTFGGQDFIEYAVYKLDTSVDVSAADISDPADTDCADIYLPLKEIKTTASGLYPTLVRDNTDFSAWIADISGSGETETAFNVNSYKNILVHAAYGASSGTITVSGITIDDLPAEDAARILAYYGTDSTGTGNSTNAKDATITVARGAAAQYITVKVGPKTSGTTFAKWRLYINGTWTGEITASEASTISFPTFSTAKLKSGGNEVMVVGVTANGGMASSKFVVTLGN